HVFGIDRDAVHCAFAVVGWHNGIDEVPLDRLPALVWHLLPHASSDQHFILAVGLSAGVHEFGHLGFGKDLGEWVADYLSPADQSGGAWVEGLNDEGRATKDHNVEGRQLD